jgi:hypothetical protein
MDSVSSTGRQSLEAIEVLIQQLLNEPHFLNEMEARDEQSLV